MPETDPVKYFQGETKRLNYYNSQFLKEEDFRDEQLYHGQMRRFHNRSLHTWGIVAGLQVSQVAGAKQVTVAPGTAIDRLGREIVLPREITLPQTGGLAQDAVSFDGFDASSQVYLTINYGEATDQADRDAQGKNFTRTIERPKFALSASAPAAGDAGVVLATIALDRDKSVAKVGTELRRYAGSRFGSSADGKEFSVFADAAGAWHFFDGAKGADRLTIDGKGNVGIGSPSPLSQLHIRKDAAGALGPVLTLMNGGGTAGAGAAIDFDGYDPSSNTGYDPLTGSPTARIQSVDDGKYSSSLLFLSKAPGASGNALQERMRISSAGNVGIGTQSPLAMLQVGKEGAEGSPDIRIGWGANNNEDRLTIYNSDGYNMGLRRGTRDLRVFAKSPDGDGHIYLMPNNTVAMTLLSNGNVGIGTNKPLGPLSVGDSSVMGSDGYIVIGKSGTPGGSRHFRIGFDDKFNFTIGDYGYNNSAATWGSQFAIAFNAPSKSLFISGDGNVGVGTNDPGTSKLKIAQSATDFAHLRFYKDATGMGELEIVGWSAGWNINTKTAGKHLYLNRDTDGTSDVFVGHFGKELTVKGDSGNVNVSGRITRQGQDFSVAGAVNHEDLLAAPWGKREDWNIFVSPRWMGREEGRSEADNALILIDCRAATADNTDNAWKVTARFKYRWSTDGEGSWIGGEANYLLVPR